MSDVRRLTDIGPCGIGFLKCCLAWHTLRAASREDAMPLRHQRSNGGTVRARILAVISETPGIGIDELRGRLPDVGRRQLSNALHELRAQGRVESPAYGSYRVPSPRPRPPAGVGQIMPLARLMASR